MGGKPRVRPPSQVDHLPFPVFGLTWYGAPSNPTKNDGCSVIAYCGGGGSAKVRTRECGRPRFILR